jgi:hypothetical protein
LASRAAIARGWRSGPLSGPASSQTAFVEAQLIALHPGCEMSIVAKKVPSRRASDVYADTDQLAKLRQTATKA